MTNFKSKWIVLAFANLVSLTPSLAMASESIASGPATQVLHRTVKVDGLDIFYREAGPQDAPTVLLLHGFPDFLSHVPQPDPGLG